MGCCDDCCASPNEARDPIKHDPEFSGPVRRRSCTDIIWLILYVLFVAGWVFVGYYGIRHGDVRRVLAPTDSQGRKCGLDSDVMHKPYLVFFDITKCLAPEVPFTGCPTPQVCVERCPDETLIFAQRLQQATQAEFERMRTQLVCRYDVTPAAIPTAAAALQHIQAGDCASYVLRSQSVLFRCIGDLSTLSCRDKTPAAADAPSAGGGGGAFESVRRYQSTTLEARPSDRSLRPLGEAVCVRDPRKAQSMLQSRATALDTYVGMIAASWVALFTSNRPEVQNISTMIVEDLVASRWYLLGALVAVVLVCFIYIVLLRWVVAPVVWTSIAGLLALLCFTIYLCWKNFAYYRDHPVIMQPTTNLLGWAESILYKKDTWMVLLVLLAVVTLVLLLMVVFLRNRIVIAIALIEEGSKAVSSNKSTVVFPLLPWLLQLGLIAFAIIILMYLLSIGDSRYNVVGLEAGVDCHCSSYNNYDVCTPEEFGRQCHSASGGICQNATCHFTGIDSPTYVTYMHIVNVVAFFWVTFWVQGMADMILAGTFATWYWTFHKSNLPFFTLTGGIYRSVRYHMGTVAFGSLIITIVRVIRLILEYVDHKLKKFDNPFTRCLMCLCKCCFLCLENFLKFINKNAYIMCAVHGKGFCSSARDAFSLLMRNIVRVFVLDKVTDFIFMVSKLMISLGVGFAVYYLLQWQYLYTATNGDRLHYNMVPAIILTIATYLVTTLFFNVYAVAVDTLFLCFLEDCERNDGSAEKPYYMSRNLMKILGKRNKMD